MAGGKTEMLPIVDVNSATIRQVWPLIVESIESADFVALDMELSGLGDLTSLKAVSVEDRYAGLRETACSHSVVSMGVACFRLEEGERESQQLLIHVDVFNLWLLCQKPFVVQPKSLQFLLEHGFDFNKQYSKGIHYCPGFAEEMKECSVHFLFAHLLKSKKPLVVHNGLVDLVFLYQSFYADLPLKLGTFVADLAEMFPSGIYDTKCISEFVTRDNASFLEYIFRKSQRNNEEWKEDRKPHIQLRFMDYDSTTCVEMVPLSMGKVPVSMGKGTVAEIELCTTYMNHGYCPHPSTCTKCHDVVVILECERLKSTAKRQQRKRRRASDKSENLVEPEENKDADESESGLYQMFCSDLDAVRSQLSTAPTIWPSGQHASAGHRSGFDAFMTGYSFLSFALQKRGKQSTFEDRDLWNGLREWANCLALRGKDLPLKIVKSHFAKVSVEHQKNANRFGLLRDITN